MRAGTSAFSFSSEQLCDRDDRFRRQRAVSTTINGRPPRGLDETRQSCFAMATRTPPAAASPNLHRAVSAPLRTIAFVPDPPDAPQLRWRRCARAGRRRSVGGGLSLLPSRSSARRARVQRIPLVGNRRLVGAARALSRALASRAKRASGHQALGASVRGKAQARAGARGRLCGC
jgi:hypothetical protein